MDANGLKCLLASEYCALRNFLWSKQDNALDTRLSEVDICWFKILLLDEYGFMKGVAYQPILICLSI